MADVIASVQNCARGDVSVAPVALSVSVGSAQLCTGTPQFADVYTVRFKDSPRDMCWPGIPQSKVLPYMDVPLSLCERKVYMAPFGSFSENSEETESF